MANINELKPTNKLNPFGKFCCTIGNLPTSYMTALTYEEQLLWFCDFLQNTVIPTVNNNAECVLELQNLYVELKNYVDNYFQNLDVQQEINNKLDVMAQDGTLNNIINQEIFSNLNNQIQSNTNNIDLLNNKIENEKYFNLHLQPCLVYDNPGGTCQGNCINNNLLYVYVETNFPYGKILVFNLETKQYLQTYNNIKFYHGNGMTFLNGKIYAASLYNQSGVAGNSNICIFDTNTLEQTEINPFNNNYSAGIMGIAVYDENHLICYMSKGSGLLNKYACILNLNNFEYSEIKITNPKNFDISFFTHFQGFEYKNNKIYFLVNSNNAIMEFIIEGNEAYLNKFYILPNYDIFGLGIGEYEDISKYNSNFENDETFLVCTQIMENYDVPQTTLKVYNFNFNTNLPIKEKEDTTTPENRRKLIFVDNSSSSLYENGTREYPFKTLNRAIAYCSNNQLHKYCSRIYIIGGNNYHLGSYNNVNITIENDTTNNYNIIVDKCQGSIQLYDSNIKFLGTTSGKFIFTQGQGTEGINKLLNMFNSKLTFRNCEFDISLITYLCDVKFYGCSSIFQVSNDTPYVALIDHGTTALLGFISINSSNNGSITVSALSTVYFPNEQIVRNVTNVGNNCIAFYPGTYTP